jgi:hypothetical protein
MVSIKNNPDINASQKSSVSKAKRKATQSNERK